MKFKVNDRVILTSNIYGDSSFNPSFGGSQGEIIGTVTKFSLWEELEVCVDWDNGTNNVYSAEYLELYENFNKNNSLKRFSVSFKTPFSDEILTKKIRKAKSCKSTIRYLHKKYGNLITIISVTEIDSDSNKIEPVDTNTKIKLSYPCSC